MSIEAKILPRHTVVWLNIVRALSAQLVVVGHLGILEFLEKPPYFVPPLQSLAVIVFYVLSGFLITHTLLRKYRDPAYDFTHFFIDRFCRIYPAYFAALVFVALIDWEHQQHFPDHYRAIMNGLSEYCYKWQNFVTTALMLEKAPLIGYVVGSQNTLIFGSAGQFWSLPLEWWLYMSVGYTALALKYGSFRLHSYLVLMAFGFIPFFFLFQGNPVTGDGMAMVWLLGGLTCLLYSAISIDLNNRALMRMVAVAAFVFSYICITRYRIAASAYDILAACNFCIVFIAMLWLVQRPCFNWLGNKAVDKTARFLASYSFSLYLTHLSLIDFLGNLDMNVYLQWGLANGFAFLFALVFEIPHCTYAAKLHALRRQNG